MNISSISLTDILALGALVLFIGACSYVNDDEVAKSASEQSSIVDNVDEQVFIVVDEKPMFAGCEDERCSNEKLIAFIVNNLEYPKKAKDAHVEGKVYVQFVVEKDGRVSDAKIVRDIGAGCGEAALAVVESMNTLATPWTPGIKDGQRARVKFTLPFSYKLES